MREKFLSKKNVKGSLGFFSSAGKAELVGQLEKKDKCFHFTWKGRQTFPPNFAIFFAMKI